jgi:hypothetical protein
LVAASSKAAFKRDSLTKRGAFFFMYAFCALVAFTLESPLNVSKLYSTDEPVAQIKCLLMKDTVWYLS